MDNPETLTNKRKRKPKGRQSRMDNPEHCQLWAHKNWQSRLKEQSRMDNPEHCQPWAQRLKEQSRMDNPWKINLRENRRDNQECTIQSTVNFRHKRLKEQSRMDNPEHCQLWAHDIEGTIKNGQSRALLTLDTRDWRSNQEWTIQSTVNLGHTRLKEQSRMENLETLTTDK